MVIEIIRVYYHHHHNTLQTGCPAVAMVRA
jgi:hypothetical protein